MSKLIPVQYHKKIYPKGITSKIKEVPLHFDVEKVTIDSFSSLHTEYSYGQRKLLSPILKSFPTIMDSHKNNIPMLWFNEEWSIEFSNFIKTVVGSSKLIKVIEIHPPFSDYCTDINRFIERYKPFEASIYDSYPNCEILIENRKGSRYKGKRFLISKTLDLIDLSEAIMTNNLKLRIVLDLPQLFTADVDTIYINHNHIDQIFDEVSKFKQAVNGIHIWGKKKNLRGQWIPHVGDLDSYFSYDYDLKKYFLKKLHFCFDDQKLRYFVPEVNSKNDDFESIISDFITAGFQFCDR